MNTIKSNEPMAPGIPEVKSGDAWEEATDSASIRIEDTILKVRKIRSDIEKGVFPTTEDLNDFEKGLQKALELASQEELNARIDALTGLLNVRAFNEVLSTEMSRIERQRREGHNYPLYAVKIDLDHFKSINDNFGHATGDLYLKSISKHISMVLRAGNTFARVGGDEFAILMPELETEHIEQVKERLLKAVLDGSAQAKVELELQRNSKLADGEGDVSASMGFEFFDGHETPDEFLEHADYYAYLAKAVGKNAVVSREIAAELDPDGEMREKFIASKEGPKP